MTVESKGNTGRVDYCKTPFPWFGGKADAAKLVWTALGDPSHYIEPFAGSLAVLLRRPCEPNRAYYSETVADTDSLLCNWWRAVTFFPNETAEAASYPVDELTKHARGTFLLRWRESEATAHLAGDPTWCDPLVAGWWAWCVSCTIGGWGLGGPWWPDETGRLRKRPRGKSKGENGVRGNLPHLGDNGKGVNRPQLREPGVWADLPHLGDNGMGVNHAGTREPGGSASLPHLTDNGMGVNHQCTREPGLGCEEAITADYADTGGYHPMTMPELRRWFHWLSARLRHVRIINGDWTGAVNGGWERLCTSGGSFTLPVRQGKGLCGVFMDPPYAVDNRDTLYGPQESFTVARDVREWCLKHGDDKRYRIVYAGFDTEGAELVAAGWREVEWFRTGHLKGGMGQLTKREDDDDTPRHQQHRERLWLSPHCLHEVKQAQRTLFDPS